MINFSFNYIHTGCSSNNLIFPIQDYINTIATDTFEEQWKGYISFLNIFLFKKFISPQAFAVKLKLESIEVFGRRKPDIFLLPHH